MPRPWIPHYLAGGVSRRTASRGGCGPQLREGPRTGWNTDITAKRVLLVTVAAVTPLPLLAAAQHARSLGAAEVYSCGVRVQGLRPDEVPEILNAYIPLTTEQAVGDPEANSNDDNHCACSRPSRVAG